MQDDKEAKALALNWLRQRFLQRRDHLDLKVTGILHSLSGDAMPRDDVDRGYMISFVQTYRNIELPYFGATVSIQSNAGIWGRSNIQKVSSIRNVSIVLTFEDAINLVAETITDSSDAEVFKIEAAKQDSRIVYFPFRERNLVYSDGLVMSPAWAVRSDCSILVDCETGAIHIQR